MDELKPCPFCGGKAELWLEFFDVDYDRNLVSNVSYSFLFQVKQQFKITAY